MSMLAEVFLWSERIGAVMLDENTKVVSFEYDPAFQRSGIQLSPLVMPLSSRVFSFPALPESFHGLPGLVADSLPDKYGNRLIQRWLEMQGRAADTMTVIERLSYIGKRGMGGLEYRPAIGPDPTYDCAIQVHQVVELAREILAKRDSLKTDWTEKSEAMRQILLIGTSAGGARAKAVIVWNPETNEIRCGQTTLKKGFEHWLIKFDGVKENSDRELADPDGYCAVEYAYFLMAKDCGIEMSDCRLHEERGRRHFMTRRFDRPEGDRKLHMLTLAGMAHWDFRASGSNSYEELFGVLKKLNLPASAAEQMYRRMVFNVIARNHDDHVKNTAFLMDRQGVWKLAPAYDMTYSYNPQGAWTSLHSLSINGKRTDFSVHDLMQCAEVASLKQGMPKRIFHQVLDVVSRWREYAEEFQIDPAFRDKVYRGLRLFNGSI